MKGLITRFITKRRTGLNRYAIHISSLYYDERIILRRGGALIFRAPVLANPLSLIYKITTLKQRKGFAAKGEAFCCLPQALTYRAANHIIDSKKIYQNIKKGD